MIISELAGAFGLRPSALRFYERMEILSPAGRVSGRRRYDEAVERLAFILSAKESAFTLSEIKELISAASQGGFSPPVVARGSSKADCLEKENQRLRMVQQSLEQKTACRCKTLRVLNHV